MHDTVVAVLRGGPSNEHEVSLKSGHTILANLSRDRFRVRDIYIDRQGVWHERGLAVMPGSILPSVDVAVICVHGSYGHDGEIQKLLKQFNVPHTGPDSFHSFHASHKVFAKECARTVGLLAPRYVCVEQGGDVAAVAQQAVRSFHQPVVVKPVDGGSSLGVSIVGGYAAIKEAIEKQLAEGARGVMVEERIKGVEASVAVVEGLRGEELYAFPPIEIIPADGHDHFSYEAKYNGKSTERCPGRFARKTSDELMQAARSIHRALGQRHYSRSDFIVSDKGVYFLELNTAAAVGMTQESLFPKSLVSVGVTLPDFLTHVVDLAHSGKGR